MMFWSLILLGLCVLCGFRHIRIALIFAIPLMLAMGVTYFEVGNPQVWFFAIYACISSVTILLFDWRTGMFLGITSLAGAAHAFGFIDALHRDIAGEALFVFGLFASTILGPTRGAANIAIGISGLRGNHPIHGRTVGFDRAP